MTVKEQPSLPAITQNRLLKRFCVHKSGDLVYMQILIQEISVVAQDRALLTDSQVMLTLLGPWTTLE